MAKKQAAADAGGENEADSSKIAEDIRAAENSKSGGDNSSKPPAVHHKKKVLFCVLCLIGCTMHVLHAPYECLTLFVLRTVCVLCVVCTV